MDPFIGEIRLFPFNFAPANWALCNGQIISIASNTALFSIIGTTYGGNGQTTFALPNLQGSTVTGVGQSPGLSDWVWGEQAGENQVTLINSELPQHNHLMVGMNTAGDLTAPAAGAFLAKDGRGGGVTTFMASSAAANTTLSPLALSPTGGGQAHENRQPYLVLNYCIALAGVYPVRN